MRPLLFVTALAAGLLVAGCNATSPATVAAAHFPKGASVCDHVHDVTSLEVARTGVINRENFGFPSSVDVGRYQARRVAGQICSLPRWPNGPIVCPDAWGPTYRLSFYDKGTLITLVDATPTGCPSVFSLTTGSLAPRQADAGFWRILGGAIGLHEATDSTFAGTMA